MQLILASSSPRRRQLMAEYGYDFVVKTAEVVESTPPYLTVAEITLFNAKQKALAVAKENPDAVVLGVDTLVALDGESLGKPSDREDAFRMVCRLSGRVHEVYSGVWAVHWATNAARTFVEVSRVRFRSLDEAEIRRYHARIDPLDKAGAYAAQDESPETVVESIEGSRTNVIGLPMESLERVLAQFGSSFRKA